MKSPSALIRSWIGILTLRAMFTTGRPWSRKNLNPSLLETFTAIVPPAIEPWFSWGHGAVLERDLLMLMALMLMREEQVLK